MKQETSETKKKKDSGKKAKKAYLLCLCQANVGDRPFSILFLTLDNNDVNVNLKHQYGDGTFNDLDPKAEKLYSSCRQRFGFIFFFFVCSEHLGAVTDNLRVLPIWTIHLRKKNMLKA